MSYMKLKNLFSGKAQILASLGVLCCALTVSQTCFAQGDGYEILRETSKAFAYLAKNTTPAVVFIETNANSKEATKGWDFSDSPLDFFSDDFFKRFFGISPKDAPSRPKKEHVYGSGFIISKDGLIITNNHVVADAEKVIVTLQGDRKVTAKVIGTDPKTDVAVIKIEGNNFPFLSLGDSSALEVGEWVMAIGNPFGLEASVTVGVVSAKGRNQLHLTDFDDFIQTDAAINPGNSGGPLLNMNGKVVGMNTAIVSPGGGGYIGIGFAVPSNLIVPVVDQLIHTGKVIRGFLGVSLQPVDSDIATSFGLDRPEGALIAEVIDKSPADNAGLKSGDVILKYNGVAVLNITQFRNSVSLMSPGAKLNLLVYRDGKIVNINAVVGTQADKEGKVKDKDMGHPSEPLGLVVNELSNEFAQRFGYTNDQGVIVTKVTPGSLADQAGIKPGALIMEIDRKKISSVSEFENAVNQATKEKRILLLLKQNGATRYIALSF